MLWPQKNSYKEFDDEKKSLQLENSPLPPPPSHNFSNGPFLSSQRREKLLFLTTMAAVTSRANQQSAKVLTLPKFVSMHFNLD